MGSKGEAACFLWVKEGKGSNVAHEERLQEGMSKWGPDTV